VVMVVMYYCRDFGCVSLLQVLREWLQRREAGNDSFQWPGIDERAFH
jgi:hypothetical protein